MQTRPHGGIGRKKISNSIGRKIRIRSDEEIAAIKKGVPLAIFKSNRSQSYTIKLNSKENIAQLFHYFYDGVDEGIYLSRKYNVFVEGFALQK